MKFKKRVISILVMVLVLVSHSFAFAQTTSNNELEIEEYLAPYQEIIDKINIEFDAHITIPIDHKEEVYRNLSKISLAKFEQDLRLDYLNGIENFSDDQMNIVPEKVEVSSAFPRGATISEQIQKCYFKNGIVFIEARISVDTNTGIIKYTNISYAGTKKPASGNYFSYEDSSYKLSDNDKKATVIYEGGLYTQNGILLLGNRTVTVTYTAGGGDINANFEAV